ncbi:diguanylate cyclase [Vibrio ponticus]|uniref:diguanylate cyclase n=1 Tax=Vibrio ponticus TaxID=265668 RepID=A0A3N3DVY0_9VIBR|nr:diguanylate cyclase [Vibrio ponticus]
MKRLFSIFITACSLAAPLPTLAVSDHTQWEEAYANALKSDKQRALSLLQDRYNALPPGVEKLYISSKLHGFMVLNGQPYHGNQKTFDTEFAKQEQLFLEGLNSEEQLDFNTANQNYTELLKHFDRQGSLDGKILFEYHLCRVLNRQALYHQADVYCSSLNTHIQDAQETISPKYGALRVIANNREFLGKYQSALETYEELLRIIPTYVDSSGIYNDTGLLLANLGYFDKAEEYLNTALDLRANTETPLKLAQTHHSMGKVLLKQNEFEIAIEHFIKSKDISELYSNLYGITFAQLGLGQAYIGLNQFDKGTRYLLDALDSASRQQNSQIRGEIYLTLADSHYARGKYISAIEFAQQALNLSRQIGSERLIAQSLKQLAEISELQGNYSSALKYYREYARSEIKKRDKDSKNAFVALDAARQNYFNQIKNETLTDEIVSLKERLQSEQNKTSIYGFSLLLMVIFIFAQLVYQRKKSALLKLDALSGSLSRTACLRHIKKQPACPTPENKSVVLLVDLDNFKAVNDAYGHPIGDKALKTITNEIKTQLTANDIIGRMGGEEFIILLKDVDELDVEQRIETIHQVINNAQIATDCHQSVAVTSTIAYLATTKALADFDELYSILDQAMFQAKKSGKNRVIDAYNDPIYLG